MCEWCSGTPLFPPDVRRALGEAIDRWLDSELIPVVPDAR